MMRKSIEILIKLMGTEVGNGTLILLENAKINRKKRIISFPMTFLVCKNANKEPNKTTPKKFKKSEQYPSILI